MAKEERRLSVWVSGQDDAELMRLREKLQGMSEAALTRILLHYGITHAADAIAEMIRE